MPRFAGRLVLICAIAPLAAFAQSPDAPVEDVPVGEIAIEEASTPFDLNNERLTGDWWGARTALRDAGIDFGFSLTTIYQHNAHGGLQTHHGHRITGSADWELTFDLEAMNWVDGGTVYAYAESGWNDGIDEDRVGSMLGVNGDAVGDSSIALFELWYEQVFWDGRARVRFGKMDLTVDFDTNRFANDETAQFLNPALVSTGNIPFPDYAIGAQMFIEPIEWFYAGVAIADAQANGRQTGFNTAFHEEDYFFSAFEFGFRPNWETPQGTLPGVYRVTVWYDPQPKEMFFDDQDGRRPVPLKRDDTGFAFNMDQTLYREHPENVADDQGLGVFFRYGFADEDTSVIEHFWSVGAQYRGLIPTRDDDVLGFGFAQGILSDKLRSLEGGDRESAYELYYNTRVFPWMSITPDIQYVVNPGAADGRDALVAGLRVQMSF